MPVSGFARKVRLETKRSRPKVRFETKKKVRFMVKTMLWLKAYSEL